MKTSFRGLIVMLSLGNGSALSADEWIGLDTNSPTIIDFRYSEQEDGSHSENFYISLPVSLVSSLDLNFSQAELIENDLHFGSDSLEAAVSLALENELSILVNYQFQGQQDELEIELFGFQLSYYPDIFNASFGYRFGEVLVFNQDEIPPGLSFPEKFRSDLDVVEFRFGWWFENLGVSFSHQIYDYEKNVSALGSRRLLQLLVKPAVLVQSDLLIQKQTGISLQYLLPQRSLGWHWLSSRSELDDSSDIQSLQMDWTEYVAENTGLTMSVGRSDDDSWSFGLGVEWTH